MSDRVNLTFPGLIGARKMIWESDEFSIHHRTEQTTSDFVRPNNGEIQAKGGVFGDSRIQFRFLYKDVGMKEGSEFTLERV